MNKNTLIIALREKTGFRGIDCELFLNSFLSILEETMTAKEKVTLANFGVFKTRDKKIVTVDPDTQKEVTEYIKVPVFRTSPSLVAKINE